MAEVDIEGVTYNIGRLNAFQQFDHARKLAPFLSALLPALRLGASADASGDMLVDLSQALQPIAVSLAQMERKDSNFILNSCLDVVRRRDPQGNYRPVRAAGPLEEPGLLLFENEMDFTILLRLVWEVMQVNLAPFFGKFLSQSLGRPNGAAGETMATTASPTV